MTQLFLGRLEQESNQKLLEKQLRLKRIQQVREQENTIRAKQSTRYRQCINESKSLKANQIKTVKLAEKQCKQEEIINHLQNALVHTGDAHRYAVDQIKRHKYEVIYESKRMETIQLNVVRREQRALEIHKQKMIEQNQHNEEIKNLKNIRDDFRHSEREDAHAAGETFASRKRMAENQRQWANAQCSGPSVKTTLRVKQSALCVEHRCEVNVNAKVMRHGLGPRDASIINDAAHEEVSLQKRQWARIMHQLLTNKKVLRRGKTAKAKVEMLRGVQFLDEELKLLQAADRTGVRVDRVRNGSSVPSVGRAEHAVRDAFEELFMSRPIDTSYAAQRHTSQENDYYNDYPHPPETTRPLVRVPEVPPLRPQHIVSGVHQPPVSLRNISENPMFFNAHSYVNERGGRRYQEQQEASEMDLLFPPNVPDTYDSRSSASGENSTSRSSNSDDSSVASRDSLCRSAPLTRTQQWASPAASPPSSTGSTPQQQQQQTPPRSGLTMLQVDFTPEPSQQGGNSSNVQADASWLQAAELPPASRKAGRSGDRFSESLRSDSTDPARHDGHQTGTDSSMSSEDKGVPGRSVGSGSTASGSGSGLSANSFSFLHKFQPKASPHSPDSVASSVSLDVLRRSTGELSDNASEEDSLYVDYRHLSGMLSQSATPSAAPAVPPKTHSSRHSVSSRDSSGSSRAEGPVVHNRVSRESISFDDSSLSGEEWVPRSTASQHSSSRSSASQSATSWALAPQHSLVRGGQSASLDSSDTLHSSLQSSEQSSSLASRPVFPPLNSFAAEDPLRTNALPLSRPPMPPPHLSSSMEAKTGNRHFHGVPPVPGEQAVRDGSRSDQLHSGSWAVSSTSSSVVHSLRDSRGLDVETISNLSQSTDFLFRQWEDLHRTNAALQQTRSATEAANGPHRTSDLSLSSSDSDTVSRGETSLSADDHSQSRGQSTRGASAMRDHSVWSSSAAEESSESRESHESALDVSHRASFFAHSSALDPLVSGAAREHQSTATGRVSYDEERAVRLMRELDELSRDWQRQLATDSNSPLQQPPLGPEQLSSDSTNRIGGHDWSQSSSSSSSSSGPQRGVRSPSIDTALLNASQDSSHSDSSSELLRDSLSTLSSAANSVVLTAITTLPSAQFFSPAADRTASVASTAKVSSGSGAEENNEEEEEEVSLQDLLLGASTSNNGGGPFASHLSVQRVTESRTTDTRSRVSTGFSSFTASALASLEEVEDGGLQFSSSLYQERPGATVSTTTSSTLSTVYRSTYIRSDNTNTLSNALLATPLTAYSLSQNNTANFSGSSGSPLTGSGRYGAGVSILSTHSLADTSLSTPRLQNRDNDVDSSSDSGSSSSSGDSSSSGGDSSESGQELSSTLSLLSS